MAVRPAQEWPARARALTAFGAGVAWLFLWYGLARAGAPSWAFLLASAVLVGPVLAFLARDWLELALWTLVALAGAAGVGYLALPVDRAAPMAFLVSLLRGWPAPVAAAALLLLLRRRAAPQAP